MDSIDRKLLSLLQDDASMPLQDIAARVGLSVNPCWRRIKRMESEGIIRARVAVLDPEKVGLNVTVFVRIKIREHTSEWVKRFAAAIRSIAEIAECHRMGGDVDYMLKVIVADIAGYDRVYKQLITKVPGLGEVSALFSMERIKYTTKIELIARVARNVAEEWISLDHIKILILLLERPVQPLEGRIGLVSDCMNAGDSAGPFLG
jgi:Lrp/AsnC family transcriptional regulator